MRGVKFTAAIAGSWAGCLAGAALVPPFAGSFASAMALPVAGAGLFWSFRSAWALAAVSTGACLILPVPWPAASILLFWLLPVSLLRKQSQIQQEVLLQGNREEELGKRISALQAAREEKNKVLRSREEAIHAISDLYGLSKQLLATLDMEQALRIAEEALGKPAPQIQPLVEKGQVSPKNLLSALGEASEAVSSEQRNIVIGQLALGLKRVSLYRQVQESATHDGLTGLLARRHCRERLDEETDRARRRGMSLVFLMVDLDYFKRVNDTYGHLVGDVVLREIAQLIERSVREVDLVGRWGGEEFGIVLPDADRAFGVQIAERIRETVAQAVIRAYDERVSCTVSIGVSVYPQDAGSADQLVEKADQALYRAKEAGRNRTVSAAEPEGR